MARLETEYGALLEELADPATSSDRSRLPRPVAPSQGAGGAGRGLAGAAASREDVDAAHELAEEASGDERQLAREELARSEAAVADFEAQLRGLLLPKDPNDGRNVIVEIRGAEGGEEANLFARDLFAMYTRYADRRHWGLEVLSESATGRDGLNEVVFVVKGKDAWRYSSTRRGRTGSSGCRSPSPRAGCTPRPPR